MEEIRICKGCQKGNPCADGLKICDACDLAQEMGKGHGMEKYQAYKDARGK